MSPKSQKTESKLVVLSAASGTGKSTLAAMLLAKYARFKLSISYTTRAPRGAEVHGTHYFFVAEDEFKKMVSQGDFLEHAFVFNKHWYGTGRESVESVLSAGQNVLFDIDVQGAKALKKAYGDRCVTIFILPPSFEELEKRLRNRKTDTPEAIEARLKTAKEEIKQAPDFDFQIVNRDLDSTFQELEKCLRAQDCIEA